MPIKVDVSEAPALVRIVLSGPWPSIDEQREVRTALIERGQMTEQTRALIDVRLVESTPRFGDVVQMVAAAIKGGGLPHFRAYLVGSAVQYGLVRQVMSVAPSTVTLNVFTDEDQAMAWLRS